MALWKTLQAIQTNLDDLDQVLARVTAGLEWDLALEVMMGPTQDSSSVIVLVGRPFKHQIEIPDSIIAYSTP